MKAFSVFLGTAKVNIRAMIYGATLPKFFDDLIKASQPQNESAPLLFS